MAPNYCGFCCKSFSTWWPLWWAIIMGQYKDQGDTGPGPLLATDFVGC